MSKVYYLIYLIFFIYFATACSNKKEKGNTTNIKDSTFVVSEVELSELAQLMREMHQDMSTVKESITKKEDPEFFLKKFKTMYTATPTDSLLNRDLYEPMAKNFLSSLDSFYSTDKRTLTKHYNIVITNCLNCHKSLCPGPISKIKKLKIQD